MPQPTLIPCYGLMTVGNKTIHRGTDHKMLQAHLIEMVNALKAMNIESRDFSSVEIKFSKRPIVESSVDDILAGLDMSLVISEDSDEYREFVADRDIDSALERAAKLQADPLYIEYMSINSVESASKMDPDSLKRLRDHMRANYPDVSLRY